jgi:hypothetical protein
MNRDCEKGLQLRLRFEQALKEWGWFDAYERAVEIMTVSVTEIDAFQIEARHARSALNRCRHVFVEHMASCLVCSRRLIVSDAVVTIREKLNDSGIQRT